MQVEINAIAVVLAALSSMVLGYFWYSPKGFGTTWVKLAKIDPKKFNTSVAMGSAVVSSFVLAFGLAYVTYIFNSFFKHSYLHDALFTGLFVWFFFQGLRMFQRAQFNQDKHQETFIHTGNELMTVLIMAAIIGAIGI